MTSRKWKSPTIKLSGTVFISGEPDLCLKTTLRVEKNWSTWVGFLSRKAKNILITSKKKTFLPLLCKRKTTLRSVEVRNTKRLDRVAEQSGAVPQRHGSNPFCTEGIVTECPLGHLKEKIPDLLDYRKPELVPQKKKWTTETVLCPAWKSLRAHPSGRENIYGQEDPCIKTVLCAK